MSVVRDWHATITVRGIQSLTRTGVPFQFDRNCWEAFEELKSRLTSSSILRHYDPELSLMVETDVSGGVIAGVLSLQHPDGEWYPVAYFSKTMARRIHYKEMLSIAKT